jgi:hypothetical protein
MALAGLGGVAQFSTWLFVLGGLVPLVLTLATVRYVDFRALEQPDSPSTSAVQDASPIASRDEEPTNTGTST